MEQYERFDRIYSEARDDLLRYLMLRTNAAPEAEDLFQEVYRRFYARLTPAPPYMHLTPGMCGRKVGHHQRSPRELLPVQSLPLPEAAV